MIELHESKSARPLALLLSTTMVLPTLLAGCGGGGTQTAQAPPPPGMSNTRTSQPAAQPRQGMSTKQKLAVLAGAAALYYIYRKRQGAQQQAGPNGKYFISKSTGRVYYRNLKTGDFQWVSPPRQPIQVPVEEAQQYSRYSGYNGRSNGEGFGGYGPGQQSYQDTEPAFLPSELR